MPDFDFDTRTPQGSNERNRPRMPLIANRLRSLFRADKLRILSMAGTLRRSLMENKLRSLLIGGVVLFVIVPASVGLFIYSFGGFPHLQQEARQVQKEARQLDPRCSGNFAQSTENSNLGDDSNETQIAFTRAVTSEPSASGPYATESELYVMNADGTNETRLTNAPESYSKILVTSPVWSPDGKTIAYLRGIDVDTGRTDRDIYVINADGSNLSSLTTVEQSTSFAWAPDGTKIAFDGWTRSGDINGPTGIYLINPDGTGQEYLTQSGATFSWSPDSRTIAFVVQSSSDSSASASAEHYDIYVKRTDGGDLTRLTNTPDTEESTPVWSPDGTKIAFTSADISGNNDIYVM